MRVEPTLATPRLILLSIVFTVALSTGGVALAQSELDPVEPTAPIETEDPVTGTSTADDVVTEEFLERPDRVVASASTVGVTSTVKQSISSTRSSGSRR